MSTPYCSREVCYCWGIWTQYHNCLSWMFVEGCSCVADMHHACLTTCWSLFRMKLCMLATWIPDDSSPSIVACSSQDDSMTVHQTTQYYLCYPPTSCAFLLCAIWNTQQWSRLQIYLHLLQEENLYCQWQQGLGPQSERCYHGRSFDLQESGFWSRQGLKES